MVVNPEINAFDQKQVIEFMKTQNSQGLVSRKFSIRVFKRLLALYAATKHTPMWKNFLALELKV